MSRKNVQKRLEALSELSHAAVACAIAGSRHRREMVASRAEVEMLRRAIEAIRSNRRAIASDKRTYVILTSGDDLTSPNTSHEPLTSRACDGAMELGRVLQPI